MVEKQRKIRKKEWGEKERKRVKKKLRKIGRK